MIRSGGPLRYLLDTAPKAHSKHRLRIIVVFRLQAGPGCHMQPVIQGFYCQASLIIWPPHARLLRQQNLLDVKNTRVLATRFDEQHVHPGVRLRPSITQAAIFGPDQCAATSDLDSGGVGA